MCLYWINKECYVNPDYYYYQNIRIYVVAEKASLNKWVFRWDLQVEREEVSHKDLEREFQALAIVEEGERSPYLRFLSEA